MMHVARIAGPEVHQIQRIISARQISSIPTWLLKAGADLVAPYLGRLFNRSLEHGKHPTETEGSIHYADYEEG